jgi:hypothetical protein
MMRLVRFILFSSDLQYCIVQNKICEMAPRTQTRSEKQTISRRIDRKLISKYPTNVPLKCFFLCYL